MAHSILLARSVANVIKLFNWNLKLWAVVIALIVVLAGTGIALSDRSNTDDTSIVLARANTEGSGIFGDEANMAVMDDGYMVLVKEKWGGKVVATPGPTSIQYMIIKEQLTKIGLSVKAWDKDVAPSSNEVQLKDCAVGTMAIEFTNGTIDGGIAWEPIYSDIILNCGGAYNVCTTDQLEGQDNHACCMVIANSSYLEENSEAVVRFLAAYTDAVDFINAAKEAGPGSEEYETLMASCETLLSDYDSPVIEASLANVSYSYELTNFIDEYVDLINNYQSSGAIPPNAMETIGQTPEQFARSHIDGTYLHNSKSISKVEYKPVTIKVAYLGADIHQLALQVAKDLHYFDDYGIVIENVGPFAAGGAVLDSVLTGQANIGFAGAPPIVMKTVNLAAS